MSAKFIGKFECSICTATKTTMAFYRPKRVEELLPEGWTFNGEQTLCSGCTRRRERAEQLSDGVTA